jgi:P27 family predicted phage terminase small subunit
MEADLPAELTDPVAQAEWTRIATMLIDSGQVTRADKAVLVGYCSKYAQWQALEKEAATHPFIVRSPNGYPLPNPALCMANKVFGLLLKAAAELGITPSSRSRVVAQKAPATSMPEGKWAGLLK